MHGILLHKKQYVFHPVDEAEIKSTIISMLDKKSSGFNEITAKMMKFVLDTE